MMARRQKGAQLRCGLGDGVGRGDANGGKAKVERGLATGLGEGLHGPTFDFGPYVAVWRAVGQARLFLQP